MNPNNIKAGYSKIMSHKERQEFVSNSDLGNITGVSKYFMITKKFGIDFTSDGGALTLSPEYVADPNDYGWYFIDSNYTSTKTHDNGWTISGQINEDYYEWVNEFEATHPVLGRVWGDFENEVYADSEEAFQDFYKNFPPTEWDYGDI